MNVFLTTNATTASKTVTLLSLLLKIRFFFFVGVVLISHICYKHQFTSDFVIKNHHLAYISHKMALFVEFACQNFSHF
jgi:hypothetical protein